MIGSVVDTALAGRLTIDDLLPNGDKGGQGQVFRTSRPPYLVKVWMPFEEPADPEASRQDTEHRYRTFAALDFVKERQLSSLPLEFVTVDGRPGYLMKHARGLEMGDSWPAIRQMETARRVAMAHSLAGGISVLHSHCVVHADIKRDNFVVDPATLTVHVLDVDGGGYFSPAPGALGFAPLAKVNNRYLAPELSVRSREAWQDLWTDPERRRQPDLWALAVLIYDILVLDPEGPFPSLQFRPGDHLRDQVQWPAPGQKQLLLDQGLSRPMVQMFEEVFGARYRCGTAVRRPTAAHWVRALDAYRRQCPRIAQRSEYPATRRKPPPALERTPAPAQQRGHVRARRAKTLSGWAVTSSILPLVSWAAWPVMGGEGPLFGGAFAIGLGLWAAWRCRRMSRAGAFVAQAGVILGILDVLLGLAGLQR